MPADPVWTVTATIMLAFVAAEFVLPDLVTSRRVSRLWSLPIYLAAALWVLGGTGVWLGLTLFVVFAGCDLLEAGRGLSAASRMTWGYVVFGLRVGVVLAATGAVAGLSLAAPARLGLPVAIVRAMLWGAAYLFVLSGGTALVRQVLDAASPAWRSKSTSPAWRDGPATPTAAGAPLVERSPGAHPEIAAAADEDQAGPGRPAAASSGPAARPAEVSRGRIIGNVERLIVTTLVCLGQYGAIGFVLAAKSLARFPQLSESRDFAEYYLIGTLVSMAVAIGTGLALTSVLASI